jgi:hypothetical protein
MMLFMAYWNFLPPIGALEPPRRLDPVVF